MVAPVIAAGLALFEAVPSLLRIFGKERPAEIVNKVNDLARVITGASDPDTAAQKLQENPELMQKFTLEIDGRAQDWARMYIEDMQNARKRDIDIQKLRGSNQRADALIVAAFSGVLLIGLAFIIFPDLSPDARTFLATVGGMLVMKIGTAFDFEFGGSAGSNDKNEIMSKMMAHFNINKAK